MLYNARATPRLRTDPVLCTADGERDKLVFAGELTPTQLVDALDTLGVSFIRGGSGATYYVEPSVLMAALAQSAETRLRLALIPLLLSHPEFSVDIKRSLVLISPVGAVNLRCYYTAAYWLQVKHQQWIANCLETMRPLPDLFCTELGVPTDATAEQALRTLATRQQELTGHVLNWYGTYEHCLKTWLNYLELQCRWNQSPLTKLRIS